MSNQSKSTTPWNKGKLVGQKPPHKLKEIWAIRVRLQLNHRYRDLALFNLAIDSMLRGSDLVKIKLNDVLIGGSVAKRAMIMQQKTGRPVQFEITSNTREAISEWDGVCHQITGRWCRAQQNLFVTINRDSVRPQPIIRTLVAA